MWPEWLDKMADQGTLVIRVDANVAIGTGHVMRCLALAQAWQDSEGDCVFAMAESTPAVEQRLRREGMKVERLAAVAGTREDTKQVGRLARENNARWIVLDGYHFDSAYQRAIKAEEFKLLCVDDQGRAETYSADLVLNQNLHANMSLYSRRDSATRLLLGPRYAMLRREFHACRTWRRTIPEIGGKILVTMGGSDPNNLTMKVIEGIRQLSNLEVETVVLVGGSNPHLHALEASIPAQKAVRLVTDSTNVAEWMAWADVAVAGAGTTFWEMCYMGLPGILLVLAENQKCVAEASVKFGIAWNLEHETEVSVSTLSRKLAELLSSKETRAAQSKKGRKLIDGRGAKRVAALLAGLELRRAVASDCEVFWQWACDPDARAASFHNNGISWEEHKKWFRTKLSDPHAILYTATTKTDEPLGAARYQIEGKRAVLSINLDARFRGRGWGYKLLAVAVQKVFDDSAVEFVDAYVKPANEASLKLFMGAGFVRLQRKIIDGQEGIHFVLAKDQVA
jgi:UDP-2,4-diacetamido-2,4,6-trideoxy-beta-L-altropyranose hydrolase